MKVALPGLLAVLFCVTFGAFIVTNKSPAGWNDRASIIVFINPILLNLTQRTNNLSSESKFSRSWFCSSDNLSYNRKFYQFYLLHSCHLNNSTKYLDKLRPLQCWWMRPFRRADRWLPVDSLPGKSGKRVHWNLPDVLPSGQQLWLLQLRHHSQGVHFADGKQWKQVLLHVRCPSRSWLSNITSVHSRPSLRWLQPVRLPRLQICWNACLQPDRCDQPHRMPNHDG